MPKQKTIIGKRLSSLLMGLGIFCLLVPILGGAPLPNDFWPNGDFEEEHTTDETRPSYWSRSGPTDMFVWDDVGPAAGQYALLIDDQDTNANGQWYSDQIALPVSFFGGTVYVQWDWTYDITANSSSDSWRFSFQFRDGSGTITTAPRVYPAGAPGAIGSIADYETFSTELPNVPAGTATLQIRIISGGGSTPNTGTLAIDNLSVSCSLDAEIPLLEGNIWPNPSVEDGSGDTCDYWTASGDTTEVIWDDQDPAAGARALKIVDQDTVASMQWYSDRIDLPAQFAGGEVAFQWAWKYDIATNDAGNSWRVSLQFRDNANNIVTAPRVHPGGAAGYVGTIGEYELVTSVFDIPADARDVQLRFISSTVGTGQLWVDNISMTAEIYEPPIDGWPAYRRDRNGSAVTDEHLAGPLSRAWTFYPTHAPKTAWPSAAEHIDRRHRNNVFNPTIQQGRLFYSSPQDDTVYALDTATGQVLWTFVADGPVRFAPTIANDKVYFGSDDGNVYCLDAPDGAIVWRYRVGPTTDVLLGNGRMISRWPVRTNVLIDQGVAYCGAGVFPYEGTFLVALNAADGTLLWRNDTGSDGSTFDLNASRYGGISPHGYLIASQDTLFVPQGRSLPCAFDRATGVLRFDWDKQPYGGSWMMLVDNEILAGMGSHSAIDTKISYNVNTGAETSGVFGAHPGLDMLATSTMGYSMHREGVTAFDRDNGQTLWTWPQSNPVALIMAGNTVFVGGDGWVAAVDGSLGDELWRESVTGKAGGLAVADGQLFVSTTTGRIYCFQNDVTGGPTDVSIPVVADPYQPDALTPIYIAAADHIIAQTGVTAGWALVLDARQGRLAYELARRTDLNIIAMEDDPANVAQARNLLKQAGLYGKRINIFTGTVDDLPDYFANLIVSDGLVVDGQWHHEWASVFDLLKPCGGEAIFGQPDEAAPSLAPGILQVWLTRPNGPAPQVSDTDGVWGRVSRGALAGASGWTHLYGDEHNTGVSDDDLVRGPLSMLWFGEPSTEDMYDRHGRPAGPVALDGRMFIQGEDRIWAYDAYNGVKLWEKPLPGAMRLRVDVDAGNLALATNGLYVAAFEKCYKLDPATGATLQTYDIPAQASSPPHRWGYISVVGDTLLGTASPKLKDYALLWNAWADTENMRWRDDSEVPEDIREGVFNYHTWWMNAEGDLPEPKDIKNKDIIRFFRNTYPVPNELARRAMHTRFNLFEPVATYPVWFPRQNPKWGVTQYLDTVASDTLFAVDVDTGQPRWVFHGDTIANIAVTVGEGVVYLMEMAQSEQDRQAAIQERLDLIGQGVYEVGGEDGIEDQHVDVRHIVALDLQTGQMLWDRHLEITGCGGEKTGLVWRDDCLVLLSHCNLKNLNAYYLDGGLAWRRITTLDATNGQVLWSKPLNYSHRPPIIGDKILAEPRAVALRTGAVIDRPHPITGEPTPFILDRMGKNCAPIQGSKHMLFFRFSDIGMYDFEKDSGLVRVGALRPSCWINMIAANGLALFPEGSSGCKCPHPLKASFAMKHNDDPKYVRWSVCARQGATTPVRHLAVNFGAPGDIADQQGAMWLSYPRQGGRFHSVLDFDLNEQVLSGMGIYGQDHRYKQVANTDRPWLFSCGILGLTQLSIPITEGDQATYTVRLGFAALPSDAPSTRVFDVHLQGQPVLENLDVYAAAGGPDTAVVYEFSRIAAAGTLQVELIPDAANPDLSSAPLLNCIEVIAEEDGGGGYDWGTQIIPIGATSANPHGAGHPQWAINGSGMVGDAHGNSFEYAMWLELNPTGSLTVDLGDIYALAGMQVWNYNQTAHTQIGIKTARIEVSTDQADWTTVHANQWLAQAAGNNNYDTPAAVALGNVVGRYVRITPLENWGDSTAVGLSEMRFFAGKPTEDTATWGNQIALSQVQSSQPCLGREPIYAVDHSGMVGMTHSSRPDNRMWLDEQPATELWLDLGQAEKLAGLKVWNYNETALTQRGWRHGQVLTSLDGSNWSVAAELTDLPTATGRDDYATPICIPLWGDIGRYLRLVLTDNWGDPHYIGLSEVKAYRAKPSDFNIDGQVNRLDLAALTLGWLNLNCTCDNGWCSWCDLTQDGYVDLQDFFQMSSHWLKDH